QAGNLPHDRAGSLTNRRRGVKPSPACVDKAGELLYTLAAATVTAARARECMRVLVNEISTGDGAETGVGCYTEGPNGGLSSSGRADLAHYPPPWLGMTLAAWKRTRRWLPRSGAPSTSLMGLAGEQPSLKHRLLQRHFERFCRRGWADLYHEPNFIPFA